MNTYTIYWTPEQQSALLLALTFLEVENAIWVEQPSPEHFALVQELNSHQYDDAVEQFHEGTCLGIKPGSNPGGDPNGLS